MSKPLDEILIPLADQFEAANPQHWLGFRAGHVTEFESLRECMAQLVAEGSVLSQMEKFQFSKVGYAKYIPRIQALRAFKS